MISHPFQGYNTGYKYKGKHLMQPKSNVTAHKKPQEQKVREQLTKERKTGTEQQKPKRLSTSAGSLRRPGKKDEERKVSTQNGGHCTYVYNACSKAVCLCVRALQLNQT